MRIQSSVLLAFLSAGMYAQPVSSVGIQSPVPPPVPGMGARMVGFSGQGPTLHYWVVARYAAGASVPLGPASVPNTPGAANLSASRYVEITWMAVEGATGYDVIRSTSAVYPAPCTACAVVLNTTSLSAADTGTALSAYPPSGLQAAQSTLTTIQTNGRDYSTPALLAVKQPGGTQIVPTLTNTPVAGQVPMISGPNGETKSTPITGPSGVCPTCELTTNKGVANGYPSLDASTLIPASQMRQKERYSWVLCGGIPCTVVSDAANHVLVAYTNTLSVCYAKAKTAPTGADLRIVIRRQGTDNIFNTFLTIPAGSTSVVVETGLSAAAALTAGQYLTIDIDQIGSALPGQDISVTCVGTQP